MSTQRSGVWRAKVVPALDHATPADRPVVVRAALEHGWSKVTTPDFDTFAKPGAPVIEVAYFRGATFEAGYRGTDAATGLDTVLGWFTDSDPSTEGTP